MAAHTCIKLYHFCWHTLYTCISSDWYFSLLLWGFPLLVMSWEYPSDVIRSGDSLSYSNKLWYQQQYPLMQWPLIHVSNCATFVSTLCIHVWALTGTLAYYYEDSPCWWHHGNSPVMSSGVGIPSPTIISFGTDSNTLLFIWFNPYSETFFCFFSYMY